MASSAMVQGRQQLALLGPWDGQTTTPYLVLPWPHVAGLLVDLGPRRILGYGYWGAPAETVMEVPERICFSTFVLEKTRGGTVTRRPSVCLDLPFRWPTELADRVDLVGGTQLTDVLVTRSDNGQRGIT